MSASMQSAAEHLQPLPKLTSPVRPYATDVDQLLSELKAIRTASLGFFRSDRGRLDYAHKMLDMCTYDPASRVGDYTAFKRRELFLCGQDALKTMEIMLVLHFPRMQTDLALIEQRAQASDYDSGSLGSLFGEHLERAQRAIAAYRRLKVLDLQDPERFYAGTYVLKCATGAEVGWTESDKDTAVLPTMAEPVHKVGEAWTETMRNLATASLIDMARGLCACYGGQSIALLGTRMPVECFEEG